MMLEDKEILFLQESSTHHSPLPFAPLSRKVSANKIYLRHQRSSRIPALRQRKEQNGISVQTWSKSQLPSHESSPILWARQLNIEGKACSSSDYVEQKLIEGISLQLGSSFIFSTARYMGVGVAMQAPAGKAARPICDSDIASFYLFFWLELPFFINPTTDRCVQASKTASLFLTFSATHWESCNLENNFWKTVFPQNRLYNKAWGK